MSEDREATQRELAEHIRASVRMLNEQVEMAARAGLKVEFTTQTMGTINAVPWEKVGVEILAKL